MRKPITFKQAGAIVLGLHVAAVVGFTQYSSYKAKIAKQLREARSAEIMSENRLKQDWNNNGIKPKVVALPFSKHSTATSIPQKNDFKPKQITTTEPKSSLPPKTESPKSVVWKVHPKPTSSIVSKPSLPSSTPVPKSTPALVSNPKPQTASKKIDLATLRKNIERIKAEVRSFKVNDENFHIKTTEQTERRIVSTRVVIR